MYSIEKILQTKENNNAHSIYCVYIKDQFGFNRFTSPSPADHAPKRIDHILRGEKYSQNKDDKKTNKSKMSIENKEFVRRHKATTNEPTVKNELI